MVGSIKTIATALDTAQLLTEIRKGYVQLATTYDQFAKTKREARGPQIQALFEELSYISTMIKKLEGQLIAEIEAVAQSLTVIPAGTEDAFQQLIDMLKQTGIDEETERSLSRAIQRLEKSERKQVIGLKKTARKKEAEAKSKLKQAANDPNYQQAA